jgi:hypothetical protein
MLPLDRGAIRRNQSPGSTRGMCPAIYGSTFGAPEPAISAFFDSPRRSGMFYDQTSCHESRKLRQWTLSSHNLGSESDAKYR